MKYLIGIDGGGTKTNCVVTNLHGKILFECSGGPSNFLAIDIDKVNLNLLDLINNCIVELNAEYIDFETIVLGTAGAGRRSDAETLEKSFLEFTGKRDIKIKSFHVESDARIALEGAFSGKNGCILISGTGSIMFGKDKKGDIHRVGGFGRLIGDQGSGYMLGRKGLIAVSKQLDGRGDETSLTTKVIFKYGFDNPEKIITDIYKNNFDIASIAPLVINAAKNGDTICTNILMEEIEELLLHISAMSKKMGDPSLKVSLIGGLVATDTYFAHLFKDELAKRFPAVIVKEPDFPPALGAIFIAKTKLAAANKK